MSTTMTTSTPTSYQYSPRPLRDLPALLLFLLLLLSLSLSTIALGFVAVARRNPAASRASSFIFDAASFFCVLPSSNLLSLSLFPSSSTQPLLSSTGPAALPSDANDDDDQYPRSPTYQYGTRPLRNLPALLLSLSTIALGFVTVARRNPVASCASSFVFDAAFFSCVLPSSNLLSVSLSPFSSL